MVTLGVTWQSPFDGIPKRDHPALQARNKSDALGIAITR